MLFGFARRSFKNDYFRDGVAIEVAYQSLIC